MLLRRRERNDDKDARDPSASDTADTNASSDSPSGGSRARLGEMLVHEGVITEGQLDEALKFQSDNGGFIGQALVTLRYIDQNTLISFLVKQCKIPHISLLDYNMNEDLFSFVSKELCLKHLCLPIDKLGKILTVAMVNPFDADALETVRQACPDLKIKPILCDYNHFDQVARKHLKQERRPEPEEVSASTFGLSTRPSMPVQTEAKKPAPEPAEPTKPIVAESVIAKAPEPLPATPEPAAPPQPPKADITANVHAFPESPRRAPIAAQRTTWQTATGLASDDFRAALRGEPSGAGFTLEDFVTAPANSFVTSLASAASERGYHAIYLHAGVGLGKTHLLHAIGNAMQTSRPNLRMFRLNASAFIRAFRVADKAGQLDGLLDRFGDCDALLFDDVHSLVRDSGAQSLFIEIYDAFATSERQIIVTGPVRADGLDPRLESRLFGGLAAAIAPPPFETRVSLVRRFAEQKGREVPDEITALIATRIENDVRRLKGAVERVVAYSELNGTRLTTEIAEDILVQFAVA